MYDLCKVSGYIIRIQHKVGEVESVFCSLLLSPFICPPSKNNRREKGKSGIKSVYTVRMCSVIKQNVSFLRRKTEFRLQFFFHETRNNITCTTNCYTAGENWTLLSVLIAVRACMTRVKIKFLIFWIGNRYRTLPSSLCTILCTLCCW